MGHIDSDIIKTVVKQHLPGSEGHKDMAAECIPEVKQLGQGIALITPNAVLDVCGICVDVAHIPMAVLEGVGTLVVFRHGLPLLPACTRGLHFNLMVSGGGPCSVSVGDCAAKRLAVL